MADESKLPPSAEWHIYRGENEAAKENWTLPDPPSWRRFARRDGAGDRPYLAEPKEIQLVNAALYLRRPLLVTGKPGVGKSSLAESVASKLGLGPVLRWHITSRSTVAEGVYRYDAIGRLQEEKARSGEPVKIGKFLNLGPLGTALLGGGDGKPRVLLVDELDKSDIDFPNDLLNVLEDGEFEIPELARMSSNDSFSLREFGGFAELSVPASGRIQCSPQGYPFVLFTSNGERDFPPAFLRRCLRLDIELPDKTKLEQIVKAHLKDEGLKAAEPFINDFLNRRAQGDLANDQLLNAIQLALAGGMGPALLSEKDLIAALLRPLSGTGG